MTMSDAQCSKPHCPCRENTCPLSSTMSIIGGKWKVQIICALCGDQPVRFNELKKRLPGVSNTVLTAALKDMEDGGLISRRQFLEVPPRVEYMVTESCNELIPIIKMLAHWGLKHHNAETGRP
ncbi:transcriptional regulator [Deltaproteobacteria bacterium Smac51]|nr:transcriptional regulator [Deltaproteobacteria bacterium Smac51]